MIRVLIYITGFLIVTGIVIGVCYGCWYLGKTVNYKLSYESMVKATCKVEIQKALKERGL